MTPILPFVPDATLVLVQMVPILIILTPRPVFFSRCRRRHKRSCRGLVDKRADHRGALLRIFLTEPCLGLWDTDSLRTGLAVAEARREARGEADGWVGTKRCGLLGIGPASSMWDGECGGCRLATPPGPERLVCRVLGSREAIGEREVPLVKEFHPAEFEPRQSIN